MYQSKLSGIAWTNVGFALLLMFVALSLAGCLPLLIPGLAYSGYQAYQTIHQRSHATATADPREATATAESRQRHPRRTMASQSIE